MTLRLIFKPRFKVGFLKHVKYYSVDYFEKKKIYFDTKLSLRRGKAWHDSKSSIVVYNSRARGTTILGKIQWESAVLIFVWSWTLGNVVLRGRTYVFPERLPTEALKIF